jgi:hypothetical protein
MTKATLIKTTFNWGVGLQVQRFSPLSCGSMAASRQAWWRKIWEFSIFHGEDSGSCWLDLSIYIYIYIYIYIWPQRPTPTKAHPHSDAFFSNKAIPPPIRPHLLIAPLPKPTISKLPCVDSEEEVSVRRFQKRHLFGSSWSFPLWGSYLS